MIEIGINEITKSFGFKNVLDNISFSVKTGEIIGLIGDNGSGKSTLLNIIAGDETASNGNIFIRNGRTIGYLRQIPLLEEENVTVKEILYRNIQEIIDLEYKMREYEYKMSICTQDEIEITLQKYGDLQNKYELLGGYEISEKVGRIVTGFKLIKLLDHFFNQLSGGEKRIVSLASLMINNPDILLLDEPTNHLDIATLEWFEDFLINSKKTILIVSHDRYFLDRVSTKTILIEFGKEIIFYGNYSYFIEENKHRLEIELLNYKNQQKMVETMKKQIKQLEEFGKLAYPSGESFFRRAENIRKRLNKIEIINKPVQRKEIPIKFLVDDRSGKDVLTIKKLDVQVDDNCLIKNVNIKICYKERVCLLGGNGTGKSTLIKMIISEMYDNIIIGSGVKIGYIPQEILFLDDNITVFEYARRCYIGDETHLRSTLSKFLFNSTNIFKKIGVLSGGEKVRLKLFELIQEKVNFIILDEPTNHVDISTKEILEEAINEYDGTVLFISHDRYFINSVAQKILSIENREIKEYIGNYNDNKGRLL